MFHKIDIDDPENIIDCRHIIEALVYRARNPGEELYVLKRYANILLNSGATRERVRGSILKLIDEYGLLASVEDVLPNE